MFLTSSQDPFQTSLEHATKPPVCGFRDYYGEEFADCFFDRTTSIVDPPMCNCTSNVREDFNATAISLENMTYFLYHFAPPIRVTKTYLQTVYEVWPNISARQFNVNPPDQPTTANCTRSRINVVFYDPESTDAVNGNWTGVMAAQDNTMYALPAGSLFNVQVQRNTFKNITDEKPRAFYTANWGPIMQTGDCSVLFSVSYATLQQTDTVVVPVKGISDYVAILGGILSLLQVVVAVAFWLLDSCCGLYTAKEKAELQPEAQNNDAMASKLPSPICIDADPQEATQALPTVFVAPWSYIALQTSLRGPRHRDSGIVRCTINDYPGEKSHSAQMHILTEDQDKRRFALPRFCKARSLELLALN